MKRWSSIITCDTGSVRCRSRTMGGHGFESQLKGFVTIQGKNLFTHLSAPSPISVSLHWWNQREDITLQKSITYQATSFYTGTTLCLKLTTVKSLSLFASWSASVRHKVAAAAAGRVAAVSNHFNCFWVDGVTLSDVGVAELSTADDCWLLTAVVKMSKITNNSSWAFAGRLIYWLHCQVEWRNGDSCDSWSQTVWDQRKCVNPLTPTVAIWVRL